MNTHSPETPETVLSVATECLQSLLAAGLPVHALRKPANNPAFRNQLVWFWLTSGQEKTAQDEAKHIMGSNYFGVEDAVRHFKISPTRAQLRALEECPFSHQELTECRDTHLLVAVFPISISEMRQQLKCIKMPGGFRDAIVFKSPFFDDRGEVGWQLIRKMPVPGSEAFSVDTQEKRLPAGDMTPKAQVLAYSIIGHFLATQERLFENQLATCSDRCLGADRPCIGYFKKEGLYVGYCRTTGCDIGLATARRVF